MPEKIEKKKRAVERSPRYPSISLREAVEKARLLYKREKRALVHRTIAVKAWGYKSLNGTSLTILASVSQYGLLRKQSGTVGISEDAFTILEAPHNSPERQEAIERCSRTPSIFDEILQKHNQSLPSDDTLKWDLKQNGFTDQGSATVIECLRDTILFVEEECGDYNGDKVIEEKEQTDNLEMSTPWLIAGENTKTAKTTWNFPLLGKTASVSILGGEPLQEDVDLLTRLLEAFKLGLSKKKVENEE